MVPETHRKTKSQDQKRGARQQQRRVNCHRSEPAEPAEPGVPKLRRSWPSYMQPLTDFVSIFMLAMASEGHRNISIFFPFLFSSPHT